MYLWDDTAYMGDGMYFLTTNSCGNYSTSPVIPYPKIRKKHYFIGLLADPLNTARPWDNKNKYS